MIEPNSAIRAAIVINDWPAVFLIGLAGAAHQAWSANLFTTTSDVFPKKAVASVTGIGGCAGGIGGFLSSLLIGRVVRSFSFTPVFTLEAQEGRLFKPLAFTKSYSMGAAALLSASRGYRGTLEHTLAACLPALGDFGFNVTTLIAGLGVGGIAVALAAQRSLENFFGAIALFSDQPVRVGDLCRFGDRVGGGVYTGFFLKRDLGTALLLLLLGIQFAAVRVVHEPASLAADDRGRARQAEGAAVPVSGRRRVRGRPGRRGRRVRGCSGLGVRRRRRWRWT